MGDQPYPVRRVAGKAAAQLVIDAAADHFVQAEAGVVEGGAIAGEIIMVKEEADGEGLGEFRSSAEAAFLFVRRSQQLVADLLQGFRPEGLACGRLLLFRVADAKTAGGGDMPGKVLSLLLDLWAALAKSGGYTGEDVPP